MAEYATESGEKEGTGGPDLRSLLVRGLARSFPWVCLFVLLGAAVGILIGTIRPNTYVSNSKLLLRVGAREQVSSESLVGVDEQRRAPPPTLVDEIQMLSDQAVFERVAQQVGAREVLQIANPARDDTGSTAFPIQLLHRLQARWFRFDPSDHGCTGPSCPICLRLAVKALFEETLIMTEPGSNVILVTHTSTSPEKARKMTQALVDAFIERHREQFSMQSLVEKNRGKVELAKKHRDDASKAYFDHLNQCGFVDLPTQGPALLTEVNTLESDLWAARVRREEISQQRASLSERLQGIPAEVQVLRPAVTVPNEEYETLLAWKRNLLGQRHNLPFEGRPIDEIHRRERDIDDQVEKIDLELKQMPKMIVSAVESHEKEPNPEHDAVRKHIDDLQIEDQALAVKVGKLQDRLTEKQVHFEQLRQCERSHKDLSTALEAEENRYKQLFDRFSILEALGNLDLHEESNLRVLQAPTLEREKVEPKRFSLLIKGLLAGMVGGAAFAVLRQHFDRKLRHPETFERSQGIPVLGVVPDLPSLRQMEKRAGIAAV